MTIKEDKNLILMKWLYAQSWPNGSAVGQDPRDAKNLLKAVTTVARKSNQHSSNRNKIDSIRRKLPSEATNKSKHEKWQQNQGCMCT